MYTLTDTLAEAVTGALGDTLDDAEAKEQVETLAFTITKAEAETLGDTVDDV